MHLHQVLSSIAPALVPTSRYTHPSICYQDGVVTAYNGEAFAHLPCDLGLPDFHVNAERLRALVNPGSVVSIADKSMVIRNNEHKFLIKKMDKDPYPIPLTKGPPFKLTQPFIEAVMQVARFCSSNAIHAWATCVVITNKGMMATNNVALAFVPYPSNLDFTLPASMVPQLEEGLDLIIAENINAVALYDSGAGITLQYQRLATEAPPAISQLASELEVCTTPVGNLKSIVMGFDGLDANEVIFKDGQIIFSTSDGDIGSHPYMNGFEFKASIEGMRLLVATATHIDTRECEHPGRLRFSNDTMRGILAGRT